MGAVPCAACAEASASSVAPRRPAPPPPGEAQAAALQYVRKISGFREPSARNAEAFAAAVDEIAAITERLLLAVGTPVAEGPDPFADPVTRRALIAARPASTAAAARVTPAGAIGR